MIHIWLERWDFKSEIRWRGGGKLVLLINEVIIRS